MWISKEEYNLLVQNSELGAKTAMKLAEILTKLNETQSELLQTKQELDDARDYANHLKASRDKIIDEYNTKIKSLIATRDEFEIQFKEVDREREELAKEASELARELTHAEVDLAIYRKAFDDIAHAFGDEFRYLLMKEAIAEEQHPVEARYATWAVSDLWFVVHDIMKNAGWRGKDADT